MILCGNPRRQIRKTRIRRRHFQKPEKQKNRARTSKWYPDSGWIALHALAMTAPWKPKRVLHDFSLLAIIEKNMKMQEFLNQRSVVMEYEKISFDKLYYSV